MYDGNGVRRLEATASLDSERDGVAEVHARFTSQALLKRLAFQKLHRAIELPRHASPKSWIITRLGWVARAIACASRRNAARTRAMRRSRARSP